MGPGLPGLGIASIFYALAALLAPVRELVLTVRGRSSRARWVLVGRQFVLAAAVVGTVVGFYVALAVLTRRGLLPRPSGPALPAGLPVVLALAALALVLLVTTAWARIVRWLGNEESPEEIAAAHRAGVHRPVIDLRSVPEEPSVAKQPDRPAERGRPVAVS